MRSLKRLLRDARLHTVCQSAGCPNLSECFEQSTATFLILGDRCTRRCRFCGVTQGEPLPVDPGEPGRVAEAAARLGLCHVVITSVTRDDLPDGGAFQFAGAARAVKRLLPEAGVETLIPDFGGSEAALAVVLGAGVDVLNHNVETVPRLYASLRPRAAFERSIGLLAEAKRIRPDVRTKSGLILGLGERPEETLEVFRRLAGAGCDILTLGQYLRPTRNSEPVHEYLEPSRFEEIAAAAAGAGIPQVQAGPRVRSSYRAGEASAAVRGVRETPGRPH